MMGWARDSCWDGYRRRRQTGGVPEGLELGGAGMNDRWYVHLANSAGWPGRPPNGSHMAAVRHNIINRVNTSMLAASRTSCCNQIKSATTMSRTQDREHAAGNGWCDLRTCQAMHVSAILRSAAQIAVALAAKDCLKPLELQSRSEPMMGAQQALTSPIRLTHDFDTLFTAECPTLARILPRP